MNSPMRRRRSQFSRRVLGPLVKGVRWAPIRPHTAGLSHAELVKAAEAAAKRALLAGAPTVSADGLIASLTERRGSANG